MLHERVAIGSGVMCDCVARGEFNEGALNAALIFLEAVKGERQQRIDKKPFTPESEQAVGWLEDTVDALASLGRELEEETIQDLQETLSIVKEGKTPPKKRLDEARSFFGALGELHLSCTSS